MITLQPARLRHTAGMRNHAYFLTHLLDTVLNPDRFVGRIKPILDTRVEPKATLVNLAAEASATQSR
ncbi:MAG: hypothetical protein AAF494_12240 [Pseudomonadota bacterium]